MIDHSKQREYMAQQYIEIERHKWIESEKAGRDLGHDAVKDWISRFAAQFRCCYQTNHKDFS